MVIAMQVMGWTTACENGVGKWFLPEKTGVSGAGMECAVSAVVSAVRAFPLRLLDRVERRFKKRKNAMAVSGRLGILRTK